MLRFEHLLIAIMLTACASTEYAYTPARPTTQVDGQLAQGVRIPPERPQGEVQLASFGITMLRTGDGTELPAVHIRMVVANNSDRIAWTVDARQQLVDLPGGQRSGVLFANADIDGMPMITVEPTQKRTIDLYFPAPTTDPARLQQFDLLWQVGTSDRAVAERTTFFRYEEAPAATAYAVGWAPHWWYDPYWPYWPHATIHGPFVVAGGHRHHFRPSGHGHVVHGGRVHGGHGGHHGH